MITTVLTRIVHPATNIRVHLDPPLYNVGAIKLINAEMGTQSGPCIVTCDIVERHGSYRDWRVAEKTAWSGPSKVLAVIPGSRDKIQNNTWVRVDSGGDTMRHFDIVLEGKTNTEDVHLLLAFKKK